MTYGLFYEARLVEEQRFKCFSLSALDSRESSTEFILAKLLRLFARILHFDKPITVIIINGDFSRCVLRFQASLWADEVNRFAALHFSCWLSGQLAGEIHPLDAGGVGPMMAFMSVFHGEEEASRRDDFVVLLSPISETGMKGRIVAAPPPLCRVENCVKSTRSATQCTVV